MGYPFFKVYLCGWEGVMWVLQCLVGRGQSSHWLSFSPSIPGAPGIEFRSSDLVAGILTCLTLSLVHRFSPVGGTLYHQGSQNHRCEHIGSLLNSCLCVQPMLHWLNAVPQPRGLGLGTRISLTLVGQRLA